MTQIDTRGEGGSKSDQKNNTYYLNGPKQMTVKVHWDKIQLKMSKI